MTRVLLVVAAVLLGTAFNQADGLAEAEARYAEGAFAEAAVEARDLDSADGWSLAAKATLVLGTYEAPPDARPALFARAAEDARRALALDPRHVDAHLQLAIALGQLADLQDPVTAHVRGYGRRGKALLERALTLDPDYAWTHGLLGVWHLQIVRHAGAALAQELYGAATAAGLEHCAEATRRAPGELALAFGCALSLLEVDPDRFRERARAALQRIVAADADDAAERLVQARARDLLGRDPLRAVY